MAIDNIVFTHPVIVDETITYSVTLGQVITDFTQVCFMFQVVSTTSGELVDLFWIGRPAGVCARSSELSGTIFVESPETFTLMNVGSATGSVDRVVRIVGNYDVVIDAFSDFGSKTEFKQTLHVLSVPCSNPTLTTKPGPGDTMDNPVLFKRSNVNSIGTEKACSYHYVLCTPHIICSRFFL